MEAIHEEAQALYEAGTIGKERMAEYDRACFVAEPGETYATEHSSAPAGGGVPKVRQATPVYARH